MVGTDFPYTKYLPESGKARSSRSRRTRSGRRASPPTCRWSVTPTRRSPRCSPARARTIGASSSRRGGDGGLTQKMTTLEAIDGDPIQPQRLMAHHRPPGRQRRHLDLRTPRRLPRGRLAHFTIRGERQFYLSGNLATMAPGFAVHHRQPVEPYPGRQCVAFVGDGGFAMLMAEHHHGVPLPASDQGDHQQQRLAQKIMWEQLVLGYPECGVRSRTGSTFRALARACGALSATRRQGGRPRSRHRRGAAPPGPGAGRRDRQPDQPPMPGKVRTSRPRGSSRRSSAASRAEPPSPAPSTGTRSRSCAPTERQISTRSRRPRSGARSAPRQVDEGGQTRCTDEQPPVGDVFGGDGRVRPWTATDAVRGDELGTEPATTSTATRTRRPSGDFNQRDARSPREPPAVAFHTRRTRGQRRRAVAGHAVCGPSS